MTNYTILLPPSEGKKRGGDENKPYRFIKNFKKNNFYQDLEIDREYIYNKIREAFSKLNEEDLEKIFEVKGKNLQEAVEILSDLENKSTMTAIDRFNGVMFKSINYETLSEKQKENFNKSIIFIDGLFGLLKPTDLIPNYKLKISAKIEEINLQKFWKDRTKYFLNSELRDKIIIDILPNAHRTAIDYTSLDNVYQIIFAEKKKNKIVNSGHNSKVLKGEIIRHIVEKEQIKEEDLINFKHSLGYKFSKLDSTFEKNVKIIMYLKSN